LFAAPAAVDAAAFWLADPVVSDVVAAPPQALRINVSSTIAVKNAG
jgi:hypothetical protein